MFTNSEDVAMKTDPMRDLRSRTRLAKSADVLCAALCGVFAALGLESLAVSDFAVRGVADAVGAFAAAGFVLVAVFGIYGRPRRMPKAVFSLCFAVVFFVCPPRFAGTLQLLCYPLLLPLLIFGARWNGARFAVLLVTLMLAFGMSPRRAPAVQGETPPASLYLPASLTVERPGGFMMIFGDSCADDLLVHMTHREGWEHVRVARFRTGLGLPAGEGRRFAVVIAGRSARFGGSRLRRAAYRWLIAQLEPDGVLVMPLAETSLLPPGDWRFAVLPGGGRWIAARRGNEVCVDPEKLDERIEELSPVRDMPIIPRGAFAAMYLPAAECGIVPPPAETAPIRAWGTLRQWGFLAMALAAWAILRLLLCRKARIGTLATASELTTSMTLYSLAMIPKWEAVMFDTGIQHYALLAGIGILLFPRRITAARNWAWRMIPAFLGVLPWLPGCSWCWLPALGWWGWLVAGSKVFTCLRADDRRSALIGAVLGVAAGAAIFRWIGVDGSYLPLCVSGLLLIPSWLRR